MSKAVLLAFASIALLVGALSVDAGATVKCPAVEVLKGTQNFVQMGASGDANIRAYDALLSDAATACTFDAKNVKVNLTFKVAGHLAPNVEARPVKVPYFVAFLSDDHVITKQIFSVNLAFGPAAQNVNVTEAVDKIMYPLSALDPNYRIVVGFQLSPAQLRQNLN